MPRGCKIRCACAWIRTGEWFGIDVTQSGSVQSLDRQRSGIRTSEEAGMLYGEQLQYTVRNCGILDKVRSVALFLGKQHLR